MATLRTALLGMAALLVVAPGAWPFVTVQNGEFVENGRRFYFAGANNYYLIYKSDLMVDEVYASALAMDLKVIRAWGFLDGESKDGVVLQPSLGVYNENGFKRLDHMIQRAGQLGLKLVIPFINNWNEFGGMNWYVQQTGGGSHDAFYTRVATKDAYKAYVAKVVNRVNTLNGIAYKDDPAVFAWQLANEPRCSSDPSGDTLTAWVAEMSAYVKSLDSNHLVTVGDEGFYKKAGASDWTMNGSEGVDWQNLLALTDIDYGTVHLYPDHWGKTAAWGTQWIRDHVRDAKALGKPVVLEEFGLHDKSARNAVYAEWLAAFEEEGGHGTQFWILTGKQDNGTPYPDYDGFDVKYPSPTATVLAEHAARMLARNEPFDATQPIVSVSDVSIDQSANVAATALFTVILSAEAPEETSVNYATADGTAKSGTDYTAVEGTLVFPPGTTERVVEVPVPAGSWAQGTVKNFTLRLSGAEGLNLGRTIAQGTIRGTAAAGGGGEPGGGDPGGGGGPVPGLSATFAIGDQWGSGFNGSITVSNGSSGALTAWRLEFDFAGIIANLWNGMVQSSAGGRFVITNADYNGSLAPGASATVGFTANASNSSQPPTNLTVTGTSSGGGSVGGGGGNLPSLSVDDVTVAPLAPARGNVTAGFFSAAGNQIVDDSGTPARLTGINWFGFETSAKVFHGLWSRNYRQGLDQIQQLGFNTLRIPFSNETLRAGAATQSVNFALNPDLQGLTPLQCLDKVIEYCGQIGLRVILDRHSAKADGYMGEDVWYVTGDAYYTEQRWIDDWVMLATRYAGHPTVIGADLFNEPKKSATWGDSAPATDWNKAAERCGNAVLAANPGWLIIVEGVERYDGATTWWGGNLKGAAAHPVVLIKPEKLVYSAHDYPASLFAQTWFAAPSYPTNLPSVWDAHWGYLFRSNTAPMLVGEFGSKLQTASDRQWLSSLLSYMDGDFDLDGDNDLPPGQKGISWTYWSFNPNSGDTGGILQDDWVTVDTTKMSYLQGSLAPSLGAGAGASSVATNAVFTITLSAPATGDVTVGYATTDGTAVAGTNYITTSGTLTFTPGQTTKSVPVSVSAQELSAAKEFTLVLSAPVNATLADASGTATLTPSGVPAFSVADVSCPEGDAGTTDFVFNVTRSANTTGTSSVDYTTEDVTARAGTDYTARSGTLVFAPGEKTKTITVPVAGDTQDEPDETFRLVLSNPADAVLARAVATGTIVNDDFPVTLSAAGVSVREGDSGLVPLTVTLTLDRAPVREVSVMVSTRDGSARAGQDYEAATITVTFPSGVQTRTFDVAVRGGTEEEPAEFFELVFSNPSAGLLLAAPVLTVTILDNDGAGQGKAPTGPFNYAEVLQKSLWFYAAQRSGPLPVSNRVSWRGDSGVLDGSDAGRDLTGGWYDAGDHVKFNFPMAASATMLAWGALEYPAAYAETGQLPYLLEELRWVCDYFLRCHVTGPDGETSEFYGQVGNGSADHAYWGPAETMTMARPAYKVTRSRPGSDLCGETAAALAATSLLFRADHPDYADELLDTARKLYRFADAYRGKYSDAITDAQSFYNSWSGYLDDLMWGALWLHRATGEAGYLDDARARYAEIFTGDPASQNYPQLKWTQAWDDKTYGSLVLLSLATSDETYRAQAQRWLDYWAGGRADNQRVTVTPGGLAWLDTWGSLRYAMNTAFCALVYADKVRDPSSKYRNFAVRQANYVLGDNPAGRSYVCGFGVNPPTSPHHRGAHGSWNNQINNPVESRHVLHGALVGGPGNNDAYTDARDNYINNEVACDYNAAFTGVMARLYELYGGYTLPDFPSDETPDAQFFVEASVNSSAANYTEIRALLNNRSAFPARSSSALRYRYFVDLSELYAAGHSKADVTVATNMLDGGSISGLLPWDEARHLYYVEVRYNGAPIYPGGSTSNRREAQFRLAVPNTFAFGTWNPANDPSYTGLLVGNNNVQRTLHIPTYENGTRLEGVEPPVSTPWTRWRDAHLTPQQAADPAWSAPFATPLGDGMPNILKYALGGAPSFSSASLQPSWFPGSNGPVFCFQRNRGATDLSYFVDATADLAAWDTVASAPPGSPFARTSAGGGFGLREVAAGEAHNTVEITPPAGHSRQFLRLRVAP